MSVVIKSKLDFQGTRGITNLANAQAAGEPLVFGQVTNPVQATETVSGIAQIATAQEVMEGSSNSVIITPLRLVGAQVRNVQFIDHVDSVTSTNISNVFTTFAQIPTLNKGLVASAVYLIRAALLVNSDTNVSNIVFKVTGSVSSWALSATATNRTGTTLTIPVTSGNNGIMFNGIMTVFPFQPTVINFQIAKAGTGVATRLASSLIAIGNFSSFTA